MEDNKDIVEQNSEELIESEEAENTVAPETPEAAAETAPDDDIQYTFVVPKGEIYQDPDLFEDDLGFDEEGIPEPVVIEPEPADMSRRSTIMANAPEPPVYAATGLPEDDDIIYTFVVPKGEVYREPDPTDTIAAGPEIMADRGAENAKKTATGTIIAERPEGMAEAAEAAEGDGAPAETIVVDKSKTKGAGKKTRYGLPADHPEMGELARKQEARRRYKQQKKNRFRTRFYVLITSLVLLFFGLIISLSGLFTIDSIEVQGNSHYTAEEIINMSHASPGRNIIYKANIKETKEFLEQNPYIKEAEVRRKLPSTLVLKVKEREERLAFKYDDDYLVMDEDGILLKKTRNTPMTTILQGIVVSKIKLGEKIGTEDNKLMDKSLDLIKMMVKSDLYFVKVDMSNSKKVNAYIYDTLVVKTDYDSLMTNMENGKLHLVVEKLFGEGIERGTITFEEDGSASFMPMF